MAARTTKMTATENANFNLIPIKYDIRAVDSYAALMHIRYLSDNITNVSPEFVIELYNTFIDRSRNRRPTMFGYMDAPIKEITKQVIGSDGYFFKMTTVKCGIDFIWHDRENETFLFWGPSNFRTVKAMNAIRYRIKKITAALGERAGEVAGANEVALEKAANEVALEKAANEVASANEDDDDCSDMPPLIPMTDEEYAHINKRVKME
jgi:hypothetical protein